DDSVSVSLAFVQTLQYDVLTSRHIANTSLSASPITKIVLSPNFRADKTIFAGTATEGVIQSADGGWTWVSLTSGLEELTVQDLAVSPAFADDRWLSAIAGERLFSSRDGGHTWTPLVGPWPDLALLSIALAPE